MSIEAIRQNLRRLEELGLLTITDRGGGRGRPNHYRLNPLESGGFQTPQKSGETPQKCGAKPPRNAVPLLSDEPPGETTNRTTSDRWALSSFEIPAPIPDDETIRARLQEWLDLRRTLRNKPYATSMWIGKAWNDCGQTVTGLLGGIEHSLGREYQGICEAPQTRNGGSRPHGFEPSEDRKGHAIDMRRRLVALASSIRAAQLPDTFREKLAAKIEKMEISPGMEQVEKRLGLAEKLMVEKAANWADDDFWESQAPSLEKMLARFSVSNRHEREPEFRKRLLRHALRLPTLSLFSPEATDA